MDETRRPPFSGQVAPKGASGVSDAASTLMVQGLGF
jgi:hypothetical protein